MLSIEKIFKKRDKTAKPTVEIQVLEDVRLDLADGTNRHVAADEIVHVQWDTYQNLEPSQRRVITDPAALPPPWQCPARPEPLPAPERLRSLPPEFVVHWDIGEQIRVAREHVEIIQDERIRNFGTASILPSGGTVLAGGANFSADRRDSNIYSTIAPYNLEDPQVARLDRLLTSAENGAVDYLHRLWALHDIPQQRRHYDCGGLYIAQCAELNALLNELGAIGYQIFRLRVLALGLTEHKNRELFCGSLDAQRFNHGQCSPQGTCSAGYGDDGVIRVYSELGMETLATLMITQAERIASMSQLLASAKIELQRATSASMPTGLPA